jgi:transposase
VTKRGRPAKVDQDADGSIVADLSLFAAHRLLERGVSLSTVAQRLGVADSLVRRWNKIGRPMRWAPLLKIISGEIHPEG